MATPDRPPADPRPTPGPVGYRSSREHLADELARLDQLLRAQVVRWRSQLAEHKPAELWGMAHVTEAEVDALLAAPFIPPDEIPAALATVLEPYWQRAAELGERIAARLAATAAEVDLRLPRLVRLFGLRPVDVDLLLLCLLPELDPRYRRLIGYLRDDATEGLPSLELALQVLRPRWAGSGRAALLEAAAVARRLVVLDDEGGRPPGSCSFRIDPRTLAFLAGGDGLDRRLGGALRPAAEPDDLDRLVIQSCEAAGLESLVAAWQGAPDRPPVTLLSGPYGSGRRAIAGLLARAAGRRLLEIPTGRALDLPLAWDLAVRLAHREAALQGAAVLWTEVERLLPPEGDDRAWAVLVAEAEAPGAPVILASTRGWEPDCQFRDRTFARLDLPSPGFAQRRSLWRTLMPSHEPLDGAALDRLAGELANGFQFTPGQIRDAVAGARRLACLRDPGDPVPTAGELFEAARRQSGRRMVTFARRIEPRVGLRFEHLVLPAGNLLQLSELRDRIRLLGRLRSDLDLEHRLSLGHGLVALFTGTSGTGKTLAAELLAQDQGVDLYKVDLAAVVSKWVGETEKNLERLFAEAETSNAILFFDEADALFGKRGDVKEARDRWANLEINYLLQRIEAYHGVVVLTTNLRQNIDEAFLRRIHVIVDFPFPDAASRLTIWQRLLPEGAARPGDEQLELVASRFQLPGGSLRNVVVDAAVRALAETDGQSPGITLRHLALGLAREYQKLGKPITRSEFGDELYGLVRSELF